MMQKKKNDPKKIVMGSGMKYLESFEMSLKLKARVLSCYFCSVCENAPSITPTPIPTQVLHILHSTLAKQCYICL